MSGKTNSNGERVRTFPPAPTGFDAMTATKRELMRYGLPERPDLRKQPGMAALWEQHARRYRDFEHLEARLTPPSEPAAEEVSPGATALFPREDCGYELLSLGASIAMVSGTWTVPNLRYIPTAPGPNFFRTFFGLGFLDVHVEMTVNAANNVTTAIRIHTGTTVNLPVRPGDAMTATLCLQTNTAGTAFYFLANENTGQTVNFTIDTGFPPAVKINAGISRGRAGVPFNPLARFGVVYFDEIVAYTTTGTRYLTNGTATSMVDANGSTLAQPIRLNDFAFKIIHQG